MSEGVQPKRGPKIAREVCRIRISDGVGHFEDGHSITAQCIVRASHSALLNGRTVRCAAKVRDHTKIESTVRYLGVELDDALALAEQTEA